MIKTCVYTRMGAGLTDVYDLALSPLCNLYLRVVQTLDWSFMYDQEKHFTFSIAV